MPGRDSTSSSDAGFSRQFELDLARRERLAADYGADYGQERVFPELVEAMLEDVPEGSSVLEVGAATGLLTRPLLERAAYVTALEPSAGLLRRLLQSDVADSERLRTLQGIVEDLPPEIAYDLAVVTFTPRRGIALARLLTELASRVASRVVMLLVEDTSLDWAYLARTAAEQGFDVRLRIVSGAGKRAVVLVADVASWRPTLAPIDWAVDEREIEVPYPMERGVPADIVRQFLSRGDRILRVCIDPAGVERLYGNLRTAVHRAGAEVAVHRHGDHVLLVRMPPGATGRPRGG
ncbi:MAG: class I SAM-dependent methyltransferase [Coriobacteriia bacterium]|nr:class I SAM-dependent methyltransferase [Coriobacteriia bacterium]